jgi:membrane-associated phospholipid phosphatase
VAPHRPAWLVDAEHLDHAIYAAIAATDTPALDKMMTRLTRAADHSKLWLTSAALLSLTRGRKGRRAACEGLASVAVTSAVANLVIKPMWRRRRPDRVAVDVPLERQVRMPTSTSFPSGHSASAFAFATGVGNVLPHEAAALRPLAATVAYSRVHTGVHYPGDVIAGSLLGSTIAQITTGAIERQFGQA